MTRFGMFFGILAWLAVARVTGCAVPRCVQGTPTRYENRVGCGFYFDISIDCTHTALLQEQMLCKLVPLLRAELCRNEGLVDKIGFATKSSPANEQERWTFILLAHGVSRDKLGRLVEQVGMGGYELPRSEAELPHLLETMIYDLRKAFVIVKPPPPAKRAKTLKL